jgi:DNA repair exonuclease SbcCD ATPase subunit
MKKLVFKYAKAENFMCFGPEGIEIKFNQYSNIVNITGQNLDTYPPRNNGVGKSSLADLIVYGLFGKTIKNPKKVKHSDVIHNKIGEKLHVEVHWDDCKVIRTTKNNIRFWKNGEEKTVGGSKTGTQQEIEKEIGLNYETFVNVVIFHDKMDAFLECDPAEKRVIAENLLSLEKYRDYFEIVKDFKKELKDNIKTMLKECEQFSINKDEAKKRVLQIQLQEKNWKNTLTEEIKKIISKIKSKKEELENTDIGTSLSIWQEAQEQLKSIADEQSKYETNRNKLEVILQESRDRLNNIKQTKHKLELEFQTHEDIIKKNKLTIEDNDQFIKSLFEKRGTRCPQCMGKVDEENCNHAVMMTHDKIEQLNSIIIDEEGIVEGIKEQISKQDISIQKLSSAVSLALDKQKTIVVKLQELNENKTKYVKMPRPNVDSNVLLIEHEINELKKQAQEKKATLEGEKTPYTEIIKIANKEVEEKTQKFNDKSIEINKSNELLPYYDFWTEAFGDSGIRSWIIKGIVPALDASVVYWLDVLFDGLVTLKFDGELNQIIERNPPNGDPFLYYAMSTGEQKMLNLSVSQSFAHVMMLTWGSIPSFVFLDEVGSNMDDVAKQGVYNMICELSKERQVFITSHDKYLLDLLQGCSEIKLEKKNGFTKMVK